MSPQVKEVALKKYNSSQMADSQGELLLIRRYTENRKCKKEGCISTLTPYTPGEWCFIHMDYGFRLEINAKDELKLKRINMAKKHTQKKYPAKEGKHINANKIKLMRNTQCSCGKWFKVANNATSHSTKTLCIMCRKIERSK